ncbi:hypothetical protein BJX64DRAFT_295152 [Aspergillus heterothallicus]
MSTPTKKATLACEKCRVLKVKCIRVEGQPCTKCTRSNSECIVPEPRQRTRPQRAKPRLADLESKLTDILGLLSRSNGSNSGDDISNIANIPDFELPDVDIHVGSDLAAWIGHDAPLNLNMSSFLPFEEPQSTQPETSNPSEVNETDSNWVTELGFGPGVVQHLLDSFRGVSSHFPFVHIPDNVAAPSLAEERPFLFLAAVTNGASKYHHIQASLIDKFKSALSENLIIAEEKDLDLLQGLLVHLAWFHFYFNPRSPQTYRYLQIAVSMAVDLGLESLLHDVMSSASGLDDPYKREACRTYLGCYYISSLISTSSGKPNSLPYSEDMLLAASALQERREFDSDKLLYPLIQLQQFVDEICETYRLERNSAAQLRSCTHTTRFMNRLQEWWSSLAEDLRCNVLLIHSHQATKIRIYELGLVYNYGHSRHSANATSTPNPSSLLQYSSPALISNLIRCTESVKEYLDLFLTIPETEYHTLPFCIWYKVIIAIFILYRLSVGISEVPEWDVALAQQTVDIEVYLGTLVSRLEVLQKESSAANKSLYTMMPEIINSVRTSYVLASEDAAKVVQAQHPHQAFAGAPVIPGRGRQRCPGMRNLRLSAGVSDMEQSRLASAVAAEAQMIENEILWSELLVADTFSSAAGTSSTR